MRRLLALMLIAMILPLKTLTADAGKVKIVEFKGLINVKEKTVKKKLKTKVKKQYSEDKVKSDVQTLMGMESFDNVEVFVDTGAWKVTFTLFEKPFISKINFNGNKTISKGTLKQEIKLKEKDFYDLAALEDSKLKILSLYADKGYPDCKIEAFTTVDKKSNMMTISVMITEGNRILIGSVSLDGVKSFKPKKVLKEMENTKKKKVFKQENLNKDIDKIVDFYKNNGFIQVEVGEPKITYNKERTQMFIVIPVNEGAKYKVGTITFKGNEIYSNEELTKSVTLKKDKIYKEIDFEETRAAISEMYSDKGYLNARVIPDFQPDKESGKMNIVFNIHEGKIVYLGKLYIDGLQSTKEFVISREITLKEGDVFAASKVKRSIEKIHNLGFIDAVDPEILPTDKPDVMDLSMNITEGKPGMLSAGAGYSSIDKLVGTLSLQHINLLGRAQKLNLMWEFGERKQNYQISWVEPWFRNKPASLGFSLFDTVASRDYGIIYSAYKESRKGGSVSYCPRLSDYLSLGFTYSYEEIGVYDIYADTTIVPIAETHDVTSSILASISYDTRDSIYDPQRGTFQSMSVQLAGGPVGGGINFIKPTVRSSVYFPTFWKFVLSLNGTLGFVQNFGDTAVVPLYERFFIGGAETVRGYKYRTEIGPENGGKAMAIFNVEYKFPIVSERKKSILLGAFFFDMGGAWENPGDFNMQIGNNVMDMKAGVGFGIRFTTPVFPLRLDWGYGFNHKPGEEMSQIYFTIGNMF